MNYNQIDGALFRLMIRSAAQSLAHQAEVVNALNVFPVPDGDTGTNMNMTFTSGVAEMERRGEVALNQSADGLSKGLLMGARGNSGVILSQIFRGLAKSMAGKTAISVVEFADALRLGAETAYQAVVKPVEGTILTVCKEAAREAERVARKASDINELMELVLHRSKEALAYTKEQLPILKKVGVVDAGGQGLVFIYEGFLAALNHVELFSSRPLEADATKPLAVMDLHSQAKAHRSAQSHLHTDEIEFGYCTEFIVKLDCTNTSATSFSEKSFRDQMAKFGDSLLVVADEDLVKVHVHADHPGSVLESAMKYGSLHRIKIENMREQHAEIVQRDEKQASTGFVIEQSREKLPYGLITVAMGEGTANIFRSIGVHHVIEGGQSMNPSTEELVNAIQQVNADKVFILPNNSNIILAAEQSRTLVDTEVIVIPTKSIPQGLAAVLAFNPSLDAEMNKQAMIQGAAQVKSGQVTYAVRDSQFDGLDIKEGDFLGISDGKILYANTSLPEVALSLLKSMLESGDEIITLLYGEEVEEEHAEALVAALLEEYPDVEVEVHAGGQPLYYYIFSVE